MGAPATKYMIPQAARYRLACPKSGCSASINATITVTISDSRLPGGPPTSKEAAISQAENTRKAGFRNSDGCTEVKPREYQRTAPLPKSVPSTGSRASATKPIRNPITPSRRTARGEAIDKSTIVTSASDPKNACR